MLLAVDVGNTQTVLGLFDGPELVADWRIATDVRSTADELHIKLRELFSLKEYVWSDVDAMVLASVVPRLTELWNVVATAFIGKIALIVGPGMRTGLQIRYDNPAEIGADRIADAVAAIEMYGAPVIVVDFGTATNIEVIDDEGSFLGGMIAPGIETASEALFSRAARLAKVDLEVPEKVIGSNTRAAVQSGLMLGEVARIDGLVNRAWDELGYRTKVIATGGLASRVAYLSSTIEALDEHLTLTGLRIIFERNVEARTSKRSRRDRVGE